LTLNVKGRVREVDAMTMAAPVTAAGSTLVSVDRSQADDYQRSLATLGHRLPLGWDATGWRSRVAGYDLLLATPRTLSALGRFLMGGDQPELGRRIPQAHREAARTVAVEFAAASGAAAPSLVGHGFDSARQPWLHAHLVYGALAAGDDGFVPLDRERVEEQADLHIFGYHLLVRYAVTELVRELGLGWAPPAADGSCEVTGLPARVLAAIEQRCRPLGEIVACRLE
jgi:hypothetical protein